MGDAAIGSRIRDGVRRAVVCREAGWSSIWAVVIEAGREDVSVRLMLRELFSPKASVVRDYRYVRDVGYPTVTLEIPQPRPHRSKLAGLLAEGCVEIRSLAQDRGHDDQIADLADVLEYVPKFLEGTPSPEEWDGLRSVVEGYARRYPGMSRRLLAFLDRDAPNPTA
jgi:hypothetical protein